MLGLEPWEFRDIKAWVSEDKYDVEYLEIVSCVTEMSIVENNMFFVLLSSEFIKSCRNKW